MTSRTAAAPAVDLRDAQPNTPGRFGFGANWARYVSELTEPQVVSATADLAALLGRESLAGVTFLDIGSGSGIHSLAASRLGARVTSFDFDPDSVGCTTALRERFAGAAAADWHVVGRGSVLDARFMASLGSFDIVYSWGVLHHTGAMREAIAAAAARVAPGGMLAIALYNDQGVISDYWTVVKRLYNSNAVGRAAMTALHLPYLGARKLVRLVSGKGALERGMSLWHDYIDWLGGYPFEVASPADVRAWLSAQGFAMRTERTVGNRQGCNEFVLARTDVR